MFGGAGSGPYERSGYGARGYPEYRRGGQMGGAKSCLGGLASPGLGSNNIQSDSGSNDKGKHTVAQRVRRIGTKRYRRSHTIQRRILSAYRIERPRYSQYLTLTEPLLIRIEGRNYRIVPLEPAS